MATLGWTSTVLVLFVLSVMHSTTATASSNATMCKTGYTGDGTTCVDIDECVVGAHNCTSNTTVCENTNGSFTCADCFGSSGDSLLSNCIDIITRQDNSSCEPGKHDCHANAICMIDGGNVTCVCNIGFNGTGRISTGGCSASSDYDSGHAALAVFASFGRLVFMAMMAALIFV